MVKVDWGGSGMFSIKVVSFLEFGFRRSDLWYKVVCDVLWCNISNWHCNSISRIDIAMQYISKLSIKCEISKLVLQCNIFQSWHCNAKSLNFKIGIVMWYLKSDFACLVYYIMIYHTAP
jgi:hypothetical protein